MNSQTMGIFLLVMAALFLLGDHLPFVGHLPGDICLQGRNGTLFIPLGTCIVVSIILSVILRLLATK